MNGPIALFSYDNQIRDSICQLDSSLRVFLYLPGLQKTLNNGCEGYAESEACGLGHLRK